MAVNVVKNSLTIKSITFGGKSLIPNIKGNKNYIYKNSNREGDGFTTKKSGKLKIKVGKYYEIKNIYIRTKKPYLIRICQILLA